MKKRRPLIAVMLFGLGPIFMLGGCETLVGGEARKEMRRENEVNLKAGKSTPREYRERRDEIDRNLK